MFTNRIFRIRKLSIPCRRHSSQLSSKYPFTKLRAFPFKISLEDAIVQMAPYASFVCLLRGIVGSIGANLLPGWGFKPIQPVQITPVYFPGWMIDAELSAEISYDDVQQRAAGVIHSSYMPGCDFRVLSWVSFTADKLENAVPFTTDLEVQHNAEVACLPYTISPFAALDVIRSVPHKEAYIQDGLRFKPSSIQQGLFAAYPILIPLYLAQYEFPSPKGPRLVTLFIEASESKVTKTAIELPASTYSFLTALQGRIRAEKLDLGTEIRALSPRGPNILHELSRILDEIDVQVLRGLPSPFFQLRDFSVPGKHDVAQAATGRLNSLIISHGAGPALVQASGDITSDVDLRIRPFVFEERKSNVQWMATNAHIRAVKRMIATVEGKRGLVGTSRDEVLTDALKDTIGSLQSRLDELEAKRHATTPLWWKEWLTMSEAKS